MMYHGTMLGSTLSMSCSDCCWLMTLRLWLAFTTSSAPCALEGRNRCVSDRGSDRLQMGMRVLRGVSVSDEPGVEQVPPPSSAAAGSVILGTLAGGACANRTSVSRAGYVPELHASDARYGHWQTKPPPSLAL
eukprot:929966-Prymnesium_polylepis.1